MDVRALLFDLDGTLLDSAPDLVGALNWLRDCEGLEPLSTAEMSHHASRGAAGLLLAGMPPAKPAQVERWKQSFLRRYAQFSFVHSRLYDGIPDLLNYLDLLRIPWGIVTNKSERLTHPLLEAAELADRASCVVCGDTLLQSKPDPAPVRHACGLLGVDPFRTLFAGDDVRDIQAGRAAGAQIAAVYYGYGSAELSEELVGDGLKVHDPREIIHFLRSQRAGRPPLN